MKKLISALLTLTLACGLLTLTASAVNNYSFDAGNPYSFYGATYYEDEYGSEYNYGGFNITDFDDPTLLPGLPDIYPVKSSTGSYSGYSEIVYSTDNHEFSSNYPDSRGTVSEVPAFTSISELTRSDGSIGTLSISSLSINMKVFPGTTSSSMSKGVGHFDGMSGWNGNVGMCGHNRGAAYTIGSIKDLKIGDTIQYTTVYGTRTYAVQYVGYIANNDWSYLGQTSDNRITLITCLANQPELRVCVQAIEI